MMRFRRSVFLLAAPVLLLLGGCGYVHFGSPPTAPRATVIGDEKLMRENSDLRLEKKMLQQELALTRSQGEALRMAIENRAADGDTSRKLVERLNESSRELALLRASYATLQRERDQAVATAAEANTLKARLGDTEEKLASSLRTYTELQQEIGQLRGEVDRTRAENLTLTEEVKVVAAKNEAVQAALAQLNVDLMAQKDARLRAEQDAETLRSEIKALAPEASVLAQLRTGAAAEARSLVAEHAAETAALRQQLDTLRTRVEDLATERNQLKQQVAAAEATGAQLTAARTSLESELAQLKQGAAGGATSQTLREQLAAAQAQATALSDENAQLKARLASASAPVTTPAVTPAPSTVNATLVTIAPGAPRPAIVRLDPSPTSSTRFHTVASGDTLAKISAQYYGTTARWGDILAANRDLLGESNNLIVGRTLRIP